jgi:hypothetical protein
MIDFLKILYRKLKSNSNITAKWEKDSDLTNIQNEVKKPLHPMLLVSPTKSGKGITLNKFTEHNFLIYDVNSGSFDASNTYRNKVFNQQVNQLTNKKVIK